MSGDTSNPIAGATESSYTTPALSSTADYWVRVSNPYGPTDSATGTVAVGVAPAITTQPQSQTIEPGSTATLSVVASGSGPLSYQWYRFTPGLVPIPGATASSYTTPSWSSSYLVRVSSLWAP